MMLQWRWEIVYWLLNELSSEVNYEMITLLLVCLRRSFHRCLGWWEMNLPRLSFDTIIQHWNIRTAGGSWRWQPGIFIFHYTQDVASLLLPCHVTSISNWKEIIRINKHKRVIAYAWANLFCSKNILCWFTTKIFIGDSECIWQGAGCLLVTSCYL